jgi:hypothetical protein
VLDGIVDDDRRFVIEDERRGKNVEVGREADDDENRGPYFQLLPPPR